MSLTKNTIKLMGKAGLHRIVAKIKEEFAKI